MKLLLSLVSLLISFCVCAQDSNSEDYIRKFHKMAIAEMHAYSIPASITLAQGILESGNGNSGLALKSKNHFGIKCHKGWNGRKVYHDDDKEQECFRKYKKVSDSYRDHSEFLKNRERYAFLFQYNMTDYKLWAKGLKKAGYATHPKYAEKLINLIERFDLAQYDTASKSGKRKVKKPKRKYRKEIFKSENGLKFVLADVGDNFDIIATEQSLWLWQLLEFNDLVADKSLNINDRVYLEHKKNRSRTEFHLVEEGETLYSIAQLHGLRLAKLYHKNRLKVGAQLQAGQKVFLRKRKPRNYSAE
mgnify:CR=1 FL=1|tara:strand:+ start:1404 stop:2312 length:909 start_codon:yes stop_codon:yes gene_type:complete